MAAATFTLRVSTTRAILVLALLLCLLVLQGVHGCVSGHGSKTRKMLQADLKDKNGSKTGGRNRENLVGWELRTVPSGPDPLHHNGGSPKKPRTDP